MAEARWGSLTVLPNRCARISSLISVMQAASRPLSSSLHRAAMAATSSALLSEASPRPVSPSSVCTLKIT